VVYARGLDWRRQYRFLAGISEGQKGVECGRRSFCCAARLVEQDVEVDAHARRALEDEAAVVAAEGDGSRDWSGTSFAAQEMDGIGGVVKMKVRRLVQIGEAVDECDEEVGEHILGKEHRKEVRSWCAWCDRIILSSHDQWYPEWCVGGYA